MSWLRENVLFRFRFTVRLKLTFLFLGLLVIGGAVLIGLTYVLVAHQGVRVLRRGTAFFQPAVEGGYIQEIARNVRAEALHDLLVQSSIGLAIIALVGVVAAWVLAGRILVPLHRITMTARRLSQETLHERIALVGPNDELKELADTFDSMLARLQDAFDSQRRFIANVSHELRTPLTIQRTLLDVALSDPSALSADLQTTLRELRDATEEQQHLIESLLLLAVSERGLDRPTPLPVAPVVQEAVDAARLEARSVQVAVRTRSLEPVHVVGNRPLLTRMVGNLVENGIRHNRPGGWVDVHLAHLGSEAVLLVRNSGNPVPREQIQGLFEPFRRLDRERVGPGGLGLGLSIVRAIVLAHGGSVSAEPMRGGGLSVRVGLPSTAARPAGDVAPSVQDLPTSA